MKTVSLICANCPISFVRPKREFERSERLGRRHYCSRACAAKGNKLSGRPNPQNLKSSNRRDEHTPFRQHLRSAKGRGWECDLTLEILHELWNHQHGTCIYTGLEMTGTGPAAASLDRIDSTKGYVKGNVQFVCRAINLAKSTFSDADMKNFIDNIRRM